MEPDLLINPFDQPCASAVANTDALKFGVLPSEYPPKIQKILDEIEKVDNLTAKLDLMKAKREQDALLQSIGAYNVPSDERTLNFQIFMNIDGPYMHNQFGTLNITILVEHTLPLVIDKVNVVLKMFGDGGLMTNITSIRGKEAKSSQENYDSADIEVGKNMTKLTLTKRLIKDPSQYKSISASVTLVLDSEYPIYAETRLLDRILHPHFSGKQIVQNFISPHIACYNSYLSFIGPNKKIVKKFLIDEEKIRSAYEREMMSNFDDMRFRNRKDLPEAPVDTSQILKNLTLEAVKSYVPLFVRRLGTITAGGEIRPELGHNIRVNRTFFIPFEGNVTLPNYSNFDKTPDMKVFRELPPSLVEAEKKANKLIKRAHKHLRRAAMLKSINGEKILETLNRHIMDEVLLRGPEPLMSEAKSRGAVFAGDAVLEAISKII